MFATETLVKPKIEVRDLALASYYIKVTGGRPVGIKKVLERIVLSSKKASNKHITVSYITEPMLFLDQTFADPDNNWFSLIHAVCDKFDYPVENIEFLSGNIYAKKSYNAWCSLNNVSKRMKISHDTCYWASRSIDSGYSKIFDVHPDKHMTLFIGRPRFQKNHVVKWYLDNVHGTSRQSNVLGTFLYANVSDADPWFRDNKHRVKELPGKLESATQDHSNAWLNGDPELFNKNLLRGLFDFTVDYVEHENIDYQQYLEFKSEQSWWQEDVLSEKLFKCILLKRPFIRLGMPHSLQRLKECGFRTFDGILFDESYDSIENFYDRCDHILKQIEYYLDLPYSELSEKVNSPEVQEVLEHNYALAYTIYNKGKTNVST